MSKFQLDDEVEVNFKGAVAGMDRVSGTVRYKVEVSKRSNGLTPYIYCYALENMLKPLPKE